MSPELPFIGEEGVGESPVASFMAGDTKMDALLGKLHQAEKKNIIPVKEGEEIYRMHVMTSAVALVYEKLRTFIDYNEEHLLRKNAIFRILKRRFIEPSKIQKIADNLIKELISAGYLPNEKLPESMKIKVTEILTKYLLLFHEIQERKGFQTAIKIYQWMLNIAAVELEETLAPAHHEKAYIQFLFREVRKRIIIEDPAVDEHHRELYFYIAVHRSLVKSDRPMLNYLLLKLFYPEWQAQYEFLIPQMAENIDEIKKQLDEPIDHKLVRRLLKRIRRFGTMTMILRQIIESPNTDQSRLSEIDYLSQRTREITLETYKQVRKKLKTAITHAIIYVFLTKMVLAFILEIPFDLLVYGRLHYFSIFVNVTFPSLILIFIALSTKTPSEKNTEAMTEGVISMLSSEPAKAEYLKPPKKRSLFTRTLFNIIYVVVFLIPFYIIIIALRTLDFSILSIGLFLAFLSIVSFFGTRIRTYAKDLFVMEKKETLGSEIVEFFTQPILRLGKWLSLNFSKINVFAMFMDFIIEAPLKLILQVLEEWFGYFKEKKEDMY